MLANENELKSRSWPVKLVLGGRNNGEGRGERKLKACGSKEGGEGGQKAVALSQGVPVHLRSMGESSIAARGRVRRLMTTVGRLVGERLPT